MRKNFRRTESHSRYIINERITAPFLRVIKADGSQIGILSRDEVLRKAREEELDLVLLSAHAEPPVAKLVNFKKFLYQESKKNKEAKKGVKKSLTKDVQLSLFIGPNDLERLKTKTQDFIKEGHQVRLKLPLRGRELGKKDMAFDLIKRFINALGDINVSLPPKMQGRIVFAVLSRKK